MKRTLLLGCCLLAAFLPVARAQEIIVTNIAFVRQQLDPETLVPTNNTQLYQVEGTVTTWVNLTTASHGLFYIQDETAGIAVFHSGAANVVPPAGARVRVKAPLIHFNGLIELGPVASNGAHEVTTLSTGNPVPEPRPMTIDELSALPAAELDLVEGSLITLTNITLLDLATPTFRSGSTEKVTDASGLPFDLRIDARTDLVSQAKPTGAFAVVGVLGQFDTSNPWTAGYQIIPSRFADLYTPSKAPTVRHTNTLSQLVRSGDVPVNTFSENAVQPGEHLEIAVDLSDPEGRPYRVIFPALDGLAPGSGWTITPPSEPLTGTHRAVFTFQPSAAQAGQLFRPTVVAWNDTATNVTAWRVYVPTAEEQRVVLMELLANPAADAASALFNPLRRDPASENPTQHDEFIELVNFNATPVDLLGWRLWDGTALRHIFYNATPVGASNAFVIYGGPLNGLPPNLDVPFEPASESSAGLALNNNGDVIALYNAQTNLVFRVSYPASLVGETGSITRYPDLNGSFALNSEVSTNAVSPGRQADGRPFSEAPPQPVQEIRVTVSIVPAGGLQLGWNSRAGVTYSVWTTPDLGTPFTQAQSGINAANGQATYLDPTAAAAPRRFYRISSP
ncbi:MAG: lamin tail domain-containing protein [Verrucomicrobiales bacterium]|nr:lamin tail domain-containing protein [Verrucomicrobiales bacterium]